jgi:hypothetical protein
MLSTAQQYFFSAPWLVFYPSLLVFALLLSFHLVAEGFGQPVWEIDQRAGSAEARVEESLTPVVAEAK